MAKFEHEQVIGLVRPEVQKGDENRDKPYTAIVSRGYDERGREITERVNIDSGEARSLERRLDKERSKMEREGTRKPAPEEKEVRRASRVATEAEKAEFMRQFKRRNPND